MTQPYIGRFAPSPTGPLHMGSLLAALGSYLQAKKQNGKWLVRIEDLDPPREVKGASTQILKTLDAFGLHWDDSIIYQSQRHAYYEDALSELSEKNAIYACHCSRKIIREAATPGVIGFIYPGYCRNRNLSFENHAIRLRTDDTKIIFDDKLQGTIKQTIATDVGDIILKRADGLYAYQLAVVVDDQEQQISEVVRGVDLLQNTPAQIYLQQRLEFNTPDYFHLPVLINPQREKLSKQTKAKPVDSKDVEKTLIKLLRILNQQPPEDLVIENRDTILKWAISNWRPNQCPKKNIVFHESVD